MADETICVRIKLLLITQIRVHHGQQVNLIVGELKDEYTRLNV